MVSLSEAVSIAQKQFLGIEGITGIGMAEGRIVFYVTNMEAVQKIPSNFMGYSTSYIITGRFGVL
jgi:hypothetical protein